MGLFGRKKKDLLYEGLHGSAVITSVGEAKFHSDKHDTRLSDFGIGNVRYPFVLEVSVDDGRAPYRVDGIFKVPASIYSVAEGTTVPVFVDPDDPAKVEINWDRFVAEGGAEVPGVTSEDVHAAFPDASRQMMVNGWLDAARNGAMSREQFEEAIAGAVDGGLLTAAEADAARASLA